MAFETITAEEFKTRYGESTASKFVKPEEAGAFSGTQDRLAEVGMSTAETIQQNIAGEGEFAGQTPLRRGTQATAAGFSAVPRGALAMAPEPIRKGVEAMGGFLGKQFGKVTEAVSETPLFKEIGELEAQGFITKENAPELFAVRESLGATAAAGEIAGTIAGAEGVAGTVAKTGGITNKVAQTAMKSSDDILAKARAANPVKANTVKGAVSGVINDTRYKLSDIDPQVETILKRSTTDDVNRYFQQAQNAKANPAKSTPLELAGAKAESAFDSINDARFKAIEGKKAILNEVADQKVSGNTINEVMSSGIQKMNEKFGAKISADGTITQTKGRTMNIDATDQKLISEYVSRMNSLGVSPSVKQVDDFVDWAQGQLYKQSKTLSKLEVASDPVVRALQGMTGDLNTRLKASVGGGYGEVNSRISQLITLQDELSRALGADARKGGGLMKTLFSPTGGNTRKIFQEILDETGVDLFKEATLAKFAMESVGDVRQASLLKQLDVAVKASSELDLTKPASIINFLRERADMDGQQLANEIIKRTNAPTQ